MTDHTHGNPLDIDYQPDIPSKERRRKLLVVAFIVSSVLIAALAQLTLKYGVDRVTDGGHSGIQLSNPAESALRVVKQPWILLGLFMFAVSAALWIVVLSRTALSFAYPFASLTYVLILVADKVFLKVDVPPMRWVGVALIMSGITIVGLTHHR